ncbi:outer membrane beta-barrel protein [Pelomonas sp. CA6]|uniref:outer membrane beta-barrel protein n=1 Tax=Pelomonas sp. CA6 TaxID=2907999 RepID=UPI001F4C4F33|nr:outer membrane beta-barrel protein [Pelomonas sp. CA6]MCH7345218.1 outer membrane beta-barrel protein [Pelomonas sp. CA6]
MHARHAPSSAPRRAHAGRWRLALCLGAAATLGAPALAQTSTPGSSPSTPSSTPIETLPPTSAGQAAGTDPSLARRDQHLNGGVGAGSAAYEGSDYSWIPYTRRGYVGLSVGRAKYDTPCGPAPLSCEKNATYAAAYTGGLFNDFLGLEIGGKYIGKADRAGGNVRAYGGTISLVAMINMESVSLYAKGGALYGRTKVSADPASGVATGTKTGWGPTLAVGLGFNFNRNFSIAVERTRDRFHFAGNTRSYVDSTNVALKYRF